MIPRANITAWREQAPWPDNSQVEQDLVISRALVELFARPGLSEKVAFRGGTALHKLYFDPPGRYSEDIDLVQRNAGPIGPLRDEIHKALDPWLGTPKWKSGHGRFTLSYRFNTSYAPVIPMRLKIEINTREHFSVLGITERPLSVENPWFSGSAEIPTYTLSELLGTKLRALYQRKKGRDLFDLAAGLRHRDADLDTLIEVFHRYMEFSATPVSRAQFEANMAGKMADATFRGDMDVLLRAGLDYDPREAWDCVHQSLISRLPGERWKGGKK